MPPRFTPLEEQVITVPLGGKLDESTNPKLIQPGSVAMAKNARYNKHGLVEKEPGFTSSAASGPRAGTKAASFCMLDECDDMMLVSGFMEDASNLNFLEEYHSQYHNSSLGGFRHSGYHVPIHQETDTVVSTEATGPPSWLAPYDPDFVIFLGNAWYVWTDGVSIYYCVAELETGAVVYGDERTILRAGGGNEVRQPHIVVLSTNIHVYWIEKNGANWDLRVADITSNDPSAVTHSVRLATVHADRLLDVCTYTDTNPAFGLSSLVLTKDAATNRARFLSRDDTNTDRRDFTLVPSNPIGAVVVYNYAGVGILFAYQEGVNVRYGGRQADIVTQAFAPADLFGLGADAVEQITLTPEPIDHAQYANGESVRVWVQTDANTVRTARALIAAPFGMADATEDEEWPFYALQSKAFMHEYRAHVWLRYDSGLGQYQETSVLVCTGAKSSANVCAMITCASSFFGKTTPRKHQGLCGMYQDVSNSDKYHWCVLTAEGPRISAWQSQFYSLRTSSVDFTRTGIKSVRPDANLIFPGGLMMCYDGVTQDHGFVHGPEVVSMTPGGVGVAFLNTKAYTYKAIYEWIDKNGLFHASIVSLPNISAVLVGDALFMDVVVRGIIAGESARDIKIALFRQHQATLVYHLVGLADNPAPGTGTVTIRDFESDTTLGAGRSPYDHGGVFPNWPTPPPGVVCKHKDRVWFINEENPTQLFYSKPKDPGVAIEFCGEFVFQLDEEATTIISNGDFLNVFTATRILAIGGEGPNKLGYGEFWQPRVVSYDTGCIVPRSMTNTDIGVVFQGPRHVYTLSADGVLRVLGDTVRDQWTSDIIRCQPEYGTSRLWFFLDDDSVLVYDYLHDRWSTQDMYKDAAVDTVKEIHSVAKTMTHLSVNSSGDGYVNTAWATYSRLPTGVKPNDEPYDFAVKGPWLTLGMLTGFTRTWFINILGEWIGAHNLRVDIYTDYNDTTPVQTITQVTSSADVPYLFRIKPQYQKATVIQIKVSDSPSLNNVAPAKLTAIELVCGFKGGKSRRAVHSN